MIYTNDYRWIIDLHAGQTFLVKQMNPHLQPVLSQSCFCHTLFVKLHRAGAYWEHGLGMKKFVVFVDFIAFRQHLRMQDLSNMFEIILYDIVLLIKLIIILVAVNNACTMFSSIGPSLVVAEHFI